MIVVLICVWKVSIGHYSDCYFNDILDANQMGFFIIVIAILINDL